MAFKDFTIEEATSADITTYLMDQMVIVCTSETRPDPPVLGMRIWESDTKLDRVYASTGWQVLKGPVQVVRKTANETVNNSSTLHDDAELFVPVAANGTYIVTLRLIAQWSTSSSDLRVSWSGPFGATLNWSTQAPHIAETQYDDATRSVNSMSALSDGADIGVMQLPASSNILGLLQTSGFSGTLRFRWAQTTPVAANTTVSAASFLRLERVA